MMKVGIVGATGYTGLELMRLLSRHPQAELVVVTSRTAQGEAVSSVFPSLRGVIDLNFSAPDTAALSDCELVFFATPNGIAMQQAPRLLDADIKVIDLSADFRLKDKAIWEQWYGREHACPGYLDKAVYGLPEVNRAEIETAQLTANPGCYPTAVQLGFLPLLENNLVELSSLIADAKSGVSGAGRRASLNTQLCEAGESFSAYAAGGHRHLPEIRQGLSVVSAAEVDLVFVPHLLPIVRGLHATLYARLSVTTADIHALYEERYAAEPFVDVLPRGAHPNTASVRGANICRIAVFRPQDGDTVVILVVEDNLVKGAAGQAVQNMNIMCRLNETTGLGQIALAP